MRSAEGGMIPVLGPAERMASWAFYLGMVGFFIATITPVVQRISYLAPILLFGGLAFGVIGVVLGLVGLASSNRVSAVAGLLLGALAVVAFLLDVFYFKVLGAPIY